MLEFLSHAKYIGHLDAFRLTKNSVFNFRNHSCGERRNSSQLTFFTVDFGEFLSKTSVPYIGAPGIFGLFGWAVKRLLQLLLPSGKRREWLDWLPRAVLGDCEEKF